MNWWRVEHPGVGRDRPRGARRTSKGFTQSAVEAFRKILVGRGLDHCTLRGSMKQTVTFPAALWRKDWRSGEACGFTFILQHLPDRTSF